MKHLKQLACLLALLLLTACATQPMQLTEPNPSETVKIGILYSKQGTMAISEMPLIDAIVMAVDEINEQGGVLGKQIEYIIEDGASESTTFASKAKKLIQKDQVDTVFGCWTSASKKSVLPVVEANYNLLWYAVQYEGMESSGNVFYTGACTNIQAIPAIEYLICNHSGEEKLKVYLLGSDYVYPRTANEIFYEMQDPYGFDIVGESYVPLGYQNFDLVWQQIRQSGADVIINTINGDSNMVFFEQYQKAGLSNIQTISFSCGEEEIQSVGPAYTEGHLFVANYFQSIDTPENETFVRNYKNRYGQNRVTSDPIQNAYNSVYLWAAACEQAGSTNPEQAILACEENEISIQAPEGLITIDPDTHHLYKKTRIGRANREGQIEQLWISENHIKPDPWLTSYEWATAFRRKKNLE